LIHFYKRFYTYTKCSIILNFKTEILIKIKNTQIKSRFNMIVMHPSSQSWIKLKAK